MKLCEAVDIPSIILDTMIPTCILTSNPSFFPLSCSLLPPPSSCSHTLFAPLSTVLFSSPVPLPYSSLLFLSLPTPTLPPLLSPHPLTLYFAFCIHSNPPLVHPCSSHPMILFLLQCPSILPALVLLLCISLFLLQLNFILWANFQGEYYILSPLFPSPPPSSQRT